MRRYTGAASIASALTTLILIFGPDFYAAVPEGLAGRMQRVRDPAYQIRAWAAFVHPLLVFAAAAGVALHIRGRAPVAAVIGLLAAGAWAFTEIAQQSLTLFAFDPWRRAWLAGDAAVVSSTEVRAAIYDGLWEAAYNLLLLFFVIACAAFCLGLVGARERLDRVVGVFFGLATVLTLTIISVQLGGPDVLGAATKWVYAATQPLARFLVGLMLWGAATRTIKRLDK